jgi:hypothetical protein
MIDLDLENLSADEVARLEAEWLAINALRDTLDIANQGHPAPTYQETLDIGERLAPELFTRQRSVFRQLQTDAVVREYQQRAEARSIIENKLVTPAEIIDSEIGECRQMLNTPGQRDQLLRRLRNLESTRSKISQQSVTEGRLLFHDVFLAERPDLPRLSGGETNYRTFQLPHGRMLRIHLLHPDRPEYSTGADLLYEVCRIDKKEIRVAFVQYKLWDGRVLYASKSRNLTQQIAKLSELCCKGDLCSIGRSPGLPEEYRLPCCGAFLRPTDRLQKKNLRLISHGVHVPICVARQLLDKEKAVRRESLTGRSLSSRVFEELFSQGTTGSRWLPYHKVEMLYHRHNIINANERIIIHAQEFKVSS